MVKDVAIPTPQYVSPATAEAMSWEEEANLLFEQRIHLLVKAYTTLQDGMATMTAVGAASQATQLQTYDNLTKLFPNLAPEEVQRFKASLANTMGDGDRLAEIVRARLLEAAEGLQTPYRGVPSRQEDVAATPPALRQRVVGVLLGRTTRPAVTSAVDAEVEVALADAMRGTEQILKLADGRKVRFAIPPNSYSGQCFLVRHGSDEFLVRLKVYANSLYR